MDGAPYDVNGSGYLGAIVPDSAEVAALLEVAFTGRYQRATDLLEQQQYTRAVSEFRAALQLAPGSAEGHNNLGVTLASLGRVDEAVDQFKQALTLRPGFDDARRNLETALRQR